MSGSYLRWTPTLCLFVASLCCAQTKADSLTIQKIDPPNWYATLPKPMLLIRGEGFTGATFSLSDSKLKIERTTLSENGHWAQLWLSASPALPETVQLRVSRGSEHVEQPYTFAARRPASDGMAGFSPRDVMYLIMTDRFADGNLNNDGLLANSTATSSAAIAERAKPMGWHGGDLRGITQHLDYLQQLGVTTVWPTPVYQNHGPLAYHGYHATDYYAVDEHYGTLADLQGLAKSLHSRGMKLVLDTVPNHVGPAHPWVKDEPAPDWFHGTEAKHVIGETHFDALINGRHAPDRDRVTTLQGWFVNLLPDMNTDSPAVAQYLRQNAVWWIEETGADGLRIDTFPYVDRPFWQAFNGELRSLYPHLTSVGEVSNGDPEVTSSFADGVTRNGPDTGLYTPFDFPFYHAAQDVFVNGKPWSRLTQVLLSDELYLHPERLVAFLDNHDEKRFAEVVKDPALQQIAYTLLLTTRGTPQIYSGGEIAMPGGNDPDNRRDFPGGFPDKQPDAFSSGGRTAAQQQAFVALQKLLKLRSSNAALQTGNEQFLFVDDNVFAYVRTLSGSASVVIALNKSDAVHDVSVMTDATAVAGLTHSETLLGDVGALTLSPHQLTLHMAPKSSLIVTLH
jgi:glycosidase